MVFAMRGFSQGWNVEREVRRTRRAREITATPLLTPPEPSLY